MSLLRLLRRDTDAAHFPFATDYLVRAGFTP